jgi:hypothetical protein
MCSGILRGAPSRSLCWVHDPVSAKADIDYDIILPGKMSCITAMSRLKYYQKWVTYPLPCLA